MTLPTSGYTGQRLTYTFHGGPVQFTLSVDVTDPGFPEYGLADVEEYQTVVEGALAVLETYLENEVTGLDAYYQKVVTATIATEVGIEP